VSPAKKKNDDAPKKKRAPAKKKAKPNAAAKKKAAGDKKKTAPKKKASAKKKTTPKKKAASKKKSLASPKKPSTSKKAATPKKSPPKKQTAATTQHSTVGLWLARVRTIVRNVATAIVVVASLCVMWVAAYAYADPPRTPLMWIRYWQGHGDGVIAYEWRDDDALSKHLLLAIVAAEDQRFYSHQGFDMVELRKALEASQEGGRLRGASTLSQQVAKNVFLWPSRSYVRKGLELCFTIAVEVCWSKQRILEVYANVVEFGPGIYGAEAASQHFFGKPAKDLTPEQAALLAACLPAPLHRSPAEPSDIVLAKQAWILAQMHNLGGTAWLEQGESNDNAG